MPGIKKLTKTNIGLLMHTLTLLYTSDPVLCWCTSYVSAALKLTSLIAHRTFTGQSQEAWLIFKLTNQNYLGITSYTMSII